MVFYRRSRTPDTPYFLTAAIHERGTRLLLDHIDHLRAAFRCAVTQDPFRIDAIVVLPDHFHLLMTLPEGDVDFSARVQTIKRRFTFGLLQAGASVATNAKREADVWQRRFWEHTIRDDGDFARHVEYIHYNPMKHGLVASAREWPHSSFHRFVKDGIVAEDWGSAAPDEPATPTGE